MPPSLAVKSHPCNKAAECRFLGFLMPDELRSPIKHRLVLHRIDPEQGIRRFYSLMIERDLFGTVRLVRNWGRIGTQGQELVEEFACEIEAGQALEAVARAKRRPDGLSRSPAQFSTGTDIVSRFRDSSSIQVHGVRIEQIRAHAHTSHIHNIPCRCSDQKT
jgi:predicted DNA-binding WGR domain protein